MAEKRESAELKAHREQEAVVNTRIDQHRRGTGEFVDSEEEIQKRGFHGEKVDPLPNEAYSLESGPDAPSAAESVAQGLRARVDELDSNA